MRFLLALSFFLGIIFSANAARLFGKVVAEDGEPLPFLTVYVEGTTYGTTTNQDGNYFLELEAGTHQIMFRYVGFLTQQHSITMTSSDIQLDIKMKPATQSLEAVIVTPDKEDPAYAVIRKAQAQRNFYKNQVKAYSCNVYIKNVQRLDEFEIPKLLSNADVEEFKKQWEKNKVVYFSESVSKYYFLEPDKEKEVVLSSKVSGDSRGFSWNSARYLDFNLYENTLDAPVGDRKFISPIASGAMMYYEYQHEGEIDDKGVKVHKIRVFPRSKGQPLFGGLLYIQDSTWRIHSTDLEITKDAGLEFVDKLSIKQVFIPVRENVWMCGTQSFLFKYSVAMMGVKAVGRGTYVGTFSNYDVTPNFTNLQLKSDVVGNKIPIVSTTKKNKPKKTIRLDPNLNKQTIENTAKDSTQLAYEQQKDKLESIILEKDFFNKEITVVLDSSNQKDATYWESVRPVPLTFEESNLYTYSDSVEKAHNEPSYLDSMDRIANKFKITDILFGYNYRNRKRELNFEFKPLTQNIQFNTVEGWVLNGGVKLSKFRERNFSRTELGVDMRYGFASQKFYAVGDFLHRFNQTNQAYIYGKGGVFVEQFDGDAISPFVNGIYTTLREENYLKIYEKRYAQLGVGTRIVDGLFAQLQGSFEERIPLQNANPFPKPYRDREEIVFTDNLPTDFEGKAVFFEEHRAAIMKLRLRYRIGEKYILRPKQRIATSSPFPTFTLTYSQGIPSIAQSKSNFANLILKIDDDMNLGIIGTSYYELQAGTFLWKDYASFADYFHFQTSPLLLSQTRLRQFLLLPYYQFSTTTNFVEFHAEHHFNGYILNRIPLIKKLKWQLVGGVHYLHSKESAHYTEVSAGVERIFKILRVDGVWNVNNQLGEKWGVRLRLGF